MGALSVAWARAEHDAVRGGPVNQDRTRSHLRDATTLDGCSTDDRVREVFAGIDSLWRPISHNPSAVIQVEAVSDLRHLARMLES